jgi:hypothetical protein
MDVDPEVHQNPEGKVLLYTSRDARPAMAIKHQADSTLPSVLKELAQKFSPIRSEYIFEYWFDNN